MDHKRIISAGLVHFHLYGEISEDGKIDLEQIDSYRHFSERFYECVSSKIHDTGYVDGIHILGVIGVPDKVERVESLILEGIRDNFLRLEQNGRKYKSEKWFDDYGNAFYRLVQENFCGEQLRFLCSDVVDEEDWKCFCAYKGNAKDNSIEEFVKEVLDVWLHTEEPELCGKQLMIRSFFLRNFMDRRVVASVPSIATGDWNLLFEGGCNLLLNQPGAYSNAVGNVNELGFWTISGVDNVLKESAYFMGKMFLPSMLWVEWQKVFLFVCALTDKVWDMETFAAAYKEFLKFMEEHICITEDVPTLISEEQGMQALLVQLNQMRGFLRGEDVRVISKDLLMTMNSRYIYIPYLSELISSESITELPFEKQELQCYMNAASSEPDPNRKGTLWEEAASYIIEHIEGWKITGRRVRTGHQEIDLSVVNISKNDTLWE